MSMFCFQCQEAAKGTGCTVRGICGKTDDVANLQDLLIYVLKGISIFSTRAREAGIATPKVDKFVMESLFSTITNANFDKDDFVKRVNEGLALRDDVKSQLAAAGVKIDGDLHDAATWHGETLDELEKKL
jgi:hydroxylamine reductase